MKHADSVTDTTAMKCELAAEVLRSFGSLRFVATGWSMLPSLWPGETLVVEGVGEGKDQDRVCVGDIVLVRREGGLCAHRVVAVVGTSENPRWITQGDALPAPVQAGRQLPILPLCASALQATPARSGSAAGSAHARPTAGTHTHSRAVVRPPAGTANRPAHSFAAAGPTVSTGCPPGGWYCG